MFTYTNLISKDMHAKKNINNHLHCTDNLKALYLCIDWYYVTCKLTCVCEYINAPLQITAYYCHMTSNFKTLTFPCKMTPKKRQSHFLKILR